MKISVVTVCRNAVTTIEDAISSVAGQTYPNIEHIVFDGVSTDGAQEIIRKFESKIARWVSEPDCGIYDAMNKGVEMATGDVVFVRNFLQKVVRNYRSHRFTPRKLAWAGCRPTPHCFLKEIRLRNTGYLKQIIALPQIMSS